MALFVDIEKRKGNFFLQVKFETDCGMLAVLGASGCGKSMTLKCIAGIEKPDKGRIVLDGEVLFDSEQKIDVKPQKRRVGYLFQQYALFPNMTVLQNIMCGVREGSKEEKKAKAMDMIDRLHIKGCEHKKPSMLSGGQQQRCALGRILLSDPKVLLLDEPFSALDAHLRFHTERQVEGIIKEFGKTVLFVSHDRDEVFRLTDNIAVMEEGRFQTLGEKHAVFDAPTTVGGAILTGCKNISQAYEIAPHQVFAKEWGIALEVGEIPKDLTGVGIRAHDVLFAKAGEEQPNTFCCRVTGEIENPFSYSLMLRPDSEEAERYILVDIGKELWNSIRASRVYVTLPPERILLLK